MSENRRERQARLRREADERVGKRANLTPAQQLENLDKRLGNGQGAKHERAKLAKQIHEEKKQKQEEQNN